MQTLRKKTSPLKYRNEPARFFGDGVVFKAKLIGILEVGEARGDRMCQEALQDLKIAIRAAGEHKQRITIHVTIEGLRLRDEKTGESLYHHPVHKISFIAQDMTDSRAFGYIFGSPDCGHRFFGIKTDKAASQVVLAMRDLFQCVFELKKKEIELAKQHIQNRITAHEHQQIKSSILEQKKTTSLLSEARSKPEKSPEATATANLVDLEQELSSIQRGITQMQRITPSEDQPPLSSSLTKSMLDDDPFGDSFSANFSSTPFNILPPPSSSKRQPKTSCGDDDSDLTSIIRKSATPPIPSQTQSSSPFPATTQTTQSNLESWFSNTADAAGFNATNNQNHSQKSFDDSNNINNDTKSELIGAFTDLDPLALGTTKPYVDKKYFFQDLKNPPKKALKDLSEHESIFDAHFSPQKSRQQQINHSSLAVAAGLSVDSSFAKTKIEKVIDPFDEEDFSKINIDQLEAATIKSNTAAKPPISPNQKSIILPDTKISLTLSAEKPKSDDTKFSYADLPSSDTWTTTSDHYRRQTSSSSTDNAPKNVFSVASKKLPKPNLFGQRNVKRDSNGINMRRLQESDSLSENEPELPPRLPDSSSHEPPPLPPKNQPTEYGRYSGRTQSSSGSRYDYASKFKSYSSDSPPSIPLPSRKINRTESNVSSSSSRSIKKSMEEEDDYLSPNPMQSDGFPQLPPPPLQKKDPSKTRGLRKSETDPKNLDAATPKSDRYREHASIIPDITLSQLLTLGIDDLAQKLKVPAAKLNTMTLVELTTYLNDFIEKSNRQSQMIAETPNDSPVFKVSFDESSDAVFEAKFDDNFGNEMSNSFVANFDGFNQAPISVIPTADRYAVFREIIDKDIQKQHTQTLFEGHHQESIESNNSNSMEEVHDAFDFSREFGNQFGGSPSLDSQFKQSPLTVNQSSSNKIAEALLGVKDRYQALRELRNIVLVEDLFDKAALPPPPLASISDSNLSDELNDDNSSINQQVFETAEAADNNSLDNIPTYSISWADAEEPAEETNLETIDQTLINEDEFEQQGGEEKVAITSNKDDLEINEYMNKAISELSLDQRLSPNIQIKTPTRDDAPITQADQMQKLSTPKLNDMSTSPTIPTIKSPSLIDASLPPPKELLKEDNLIDKELAVDTGSEQLTASADDSREKTLTPSGAKPLAEQLDSWANFEQETEKLKDSKSEQLPPQQQPKHDQQESGSSDGKLEWKQREKEYRKRWPKQHTSSSSRDVSPWEEGNHPVDQKKRSTHAGHPSHYDRYARPPVGNSRRRRNSCDEDLEDDYEKRPPPMPSRMRASKVSIHRSKEILEAENPSWYGDERGDRWYPDDEDDEQQRMDRHRSHFERNAYERSTYGPPYMIDKREPKSFPYDRRGFDKRSKYYRYNRPEYDYDPYEAPPAQRTNKARKDYDDYEPGTFERGSRESRSAREYFYDRERDRRSFDSNESYDSGRMHRMGSGDIYHDNYRDRYVAKMQRRGQRSRMDDDSEEELPPRRPSAESGGSLQRSQAQRSKLGNIKLDDEVWGAAGKWKQRPSSAAADRMSGSAGNLSDSDGEKEKRHRRKSRQSRSKEVELRSNYATIRHPPPPPPPLVQSRRDYYDYENDPNECYEEPRSPSNASPRGSDGYYRKRPTVNVRASTTPKIDNKSFSEYVKPGYDDFEDRMPIQKPQQHFKKSTSRDLYIDESERKPVNTKIDQPQLPPQHSGKFNFDGFESDFNASSPKQQQQQQQQDQQQQSQDSQKFPYEGDSRTSPNPSVTKNANNQQKLRFNENVAVSKFDKNSTSQQMFEDDFIESWTPEITSQGATSSMQSSLKKTPMSNLKFSKHENIKKSDSVNIFARKNDEDPFANDDFFNSEGGNDEDKNEPDDPFQWSSKNNFANFDDNKNI